MTNQEAKAEAEKIINKFYLYSAHQNSVKARREQAKYCAIIHVKGIIEEYETIDPESINELVTGQIKYWIKVKEEVNNL